MGKASPSFKPGLLWLHYTRVLLLHVAGLPLHLCVGAAAQSPGLAQHAPTLSAPTRASAHAPGTQLADWLQLANLRHSSISRILTLASSYQCCF